MNKNHELLTKGNEVHLINEEAKTTSLQEAVGIVAMSVYSEMIALEKANDADENKRLEEKILFQSEVLNSLSNALTAIRPYVL